MTDQPSRSLPYHVRLLQAELDARRERNPRYSMRSFARILGIDPSALSRILRGQQEVAPRSCPAILRSLKLSDERKQLFVTSVVSEKKRLELREILRELGSDGPADRDHGPARLPIDLYSRMLDIHHLGIVELTGVQGFVSDPDWIARQLGITRQHAEWAIHLLVRAGALAWSNGKLVRNGETARAGAGLHDTIHQIEQQKSVLRRLLEQLEDDEPEPGSGSGSVKSSRLVRGMTLAAAAEDLPQARILVEQFLADLSDLLAANASGGKARTYQLAVQLVPLDPTT